MAGKFSAGLTMVMTWQPTGSTVVTTLGAKARGLSHPAQVADADASGYGDAINVYVKMRGDESISFELMLDDTTLTMEELFIHGALGTLIYYPAGNASGKRRVTFPCFVSESNDDYPDTDVAVRSITLKPTAATTRDAVSP